MSLAVDPTLADELRALEHRRTQALVARDLATLEALHAPGYQLITPAGRVFGRAEYLAAIAREPFYAAWEAGEIVVQAGTGLALLRYPVRLVFPSGRAMHCWHLDSYVQHEGRWLAQWSQATGRTDLPATPRSAPTPPLRLRPVGPAEALPLGRMLELYQHDLSDLWDQDLDERGEFGYALERFLERRDAWAYLFEVEGQRAGCALVDRRVRIPGDDFWMDQFFVLKKYRRLGVGAAGARAVFAAHPGRWQVGQMPANRPAQAFWRRVIGDLSGGAFAETVLDSGPWQGLVQRFTATG